MSELEQLFQASVEAHQAGNLALAAQGYALVLNVAPETSDAWHLAGLVAHQSGKSAQGIQCIERAIQLKRDAEYFTNLAAIHFSLDELETAASYSARALEIDPEFAPAHFRRGVVLASLFRYDEALLSFNAALEANFCPDTSLVEIALILQSMGNLPQAIQAFDLALMLNPKQSTAYYNLSRLVISGEYEFSSEQVNQIQTILASYEGVPSQAESTARFRFALGCHCEHQSDFNEAFTHYQRGNAAAALTTNQSESAQERLALADSVDRTIQYFSPAQIAADRDRARCDRVDPASNQPVFVIGLPRSGTTLVAKILSSHPEVGYADESTALFESIYEHRGIWTSGLEVVPFNDQAITRAQSRYRQGLLGLADGRPWMVDKMPDNYRYLGFIHSMFPNVPIYYCRRDPRDIALSNFGILFDSKRLRWETSSLERIAETIRQHYRMMAHWELVFPGRVHSVFYETLVGDTKAVSQELIRHAGLAWSDSCLSPENQCASVRTASMVQVCRPVYQTSVGRWRNFEQHLRPLVDILAPEIADYEQALSALPKKD